MDRLVKGNKAICEPSLTCPAKDDQHKSWGELTGSRKEIDKRNKVIIEKYRNGVSVNELANEYCLSIYAIRKIIYQN